MVLFLCIPSDVASYLFKIMKVYLTVQSFINDTIFILNIPVENNSEKTNGEVMVLVFCKLYDKALYLFQDS